MREICQLVLSRGDVFPSLSRKEIEGSRSAGASDFSIIFKGRGEGGKVGREGRGIDVIAFGGGKGKEAAKCGSGRDQWRKKRKGGGEGGRGAQGGLSGQLPAVIFFHIRRKRRKGKGEGREEKDWLGALPFPNRKRRGRRKEEKGGSK